MLNEISDDLEITWLWAKSMEWKMSSAKMKMTKWNSFLAVVLELFEK